LFSANSVIFVSYKHGENKLILNVLLMTQRHLIKYNKLNTVIFDISNNLRIYFLLPYNNLKYVVSITSFVLLTITRQLFMFSTLYMIYL